MNFATGIATLKKATGLLLGRHGFKRFLLVMYAAMMLGMVILGGLAKSFSIDVAAPGNDFAAMFLMGIYAVGLLIYCVFFEVGGMALTLRALGRECRPWSEVVGRSWAIIKQLMAINIPLAGLLLALILVRPEIMLIGSLRTVLVVGIYIWGLVQCYALNSLAYERRSLYSGLCDSMKFFIRAFWAHLGVAVSYIFFVLAWIALISLVAGVASCVWWLKPIVLLLIPLTMVMYCFLLNIMGIAIGLLYIEYRQ